MDISLYNKDVNIHVIDTATQSALGMMNTETMKIAIGRKYKIIPVINSFQFISSSEQ